MEELENEEMNRELEPSIEPTLFVPSLCLTNVMSLTPKIDELRIFLQHEKADICCITETWLKDTIDDNVISIQNYQIVRKENIHSTRRGGSLCKRKY